MPFIIRSIYVSNYYGTNKGLDGTVTFEEAGSKTELKIKLTEEDAIAIFEVFGDRVAATMQTAAMAMLADIKPKVESALPRPEKPEFEPPQAPDDDIPF